MLLKPESVLQQVFLTVWSVAVSRQQCVSVLEKISAITFSLMLSVSFRSYGGGRSVAAATAAATHFPVSRYLCLTTALSFPEAAPKTTKTPSLDDERFVLCPSWELVS